MLVWRILDQEGLTCAKSELATKFFLVEEHNVHFCSVAQAHQPCSLSRLEEIIASTPLSVSSTFLFSKISQSEVNTQLKNLFSKSRGRSPDGLPLKHLAKFITFIFNISIDTFSYPSVWKIAFLIALNKI